ncbi:MAG TPA: DUF1444 family protein [Gemmataceae bacterium]|jgi:uncharacterized protein YtpQ (UPF0354 family)|nr:DUF1444 family protein [Gemmataceae bacterium]
MLPKFVKTFVHPHKAYQLEYPGHWDAVVEKDGESCGFGPHERDDVGLWISILPASVDTERMIDELPQFMQQALDRAEAVNLRQDKSLKHYGLIADMTKENQGGHYWIVAGGDLLLFASTQVPAAEHEQWNPMFAQLMASLLITRDDELLFRQVANQVMVELKQRFPTEEFKYIAYNKIEGKGQVIYLGNLFRDVREKPQERRDHLIQRFVATITQPATKDIGHETWEDVQTRILPVLKPRNYMVPGTATEHLLTSEWLVDVLLCYVIMSKKMFRFVTGWDVNRWGTDAAAVHELALKNLAELPWPKEIMGASFRNEGRVMVIDTDDSLASSRILHPELYQLFSGPLGTPFWAGIPDRNTLVLFSDRKALKQRIGRKVKKDHHTSAYPITPQMFLVTRDGIAPGREK